MKPSEVLRAARKLIEKPENWTKDTYGFGHIRKIDDTKQKCGCALGACIAAGYINFAKPSSAVTLLDQDAQHYGFRNAIHANDDPATTHKQVLRAFDRCIKAAEAAGE